MNKNLNISTAKQTEMRIGNTTYIVSGRFNGDKKHSISAILARIISRDVNKGSGFPKISA